MIANAKKPSTFRSAALEHLCPHQCQNQTYSLEAVTSSYHWNIWWRRHKRAFQLCCQLETEDMFSFLFFFQVAPESYYTLFVKVSPFIRHQNTNCSDCISPVECLTVTLSYVAMDTCLKVRQTDQTSSNTDQRFNMMNLAKEHLKTNADSHGTPNKRLLLSVCFRMFDWCALGLHLLFSEDLMCM